MAIVLKKKKVNKKERKEAEEMGTAGLTGRYHALAAGAGRS